MRYNVAGLLKAPTGDTRRQPLEASPTIDDPTVRLTEPVRGEVLFTREPSGVLVQARLHSRFSAVCARCLTPMHQEIEFDLTESFRPTILLPGGPPVEVDDDTDPATLIDELNVLDLTEVVRQATELALPLRPLCSEACRGLCPRCGKDLNAGGCDCGPEPDPRWAVLRDILGDADPSGSGGA